MIDPTQRHYRTGLERDRFGQTCKPRPIQGMTLANSRAALSDERAGIVSTTSRVAVRTLGRMKRRDSSRCV